MTTLLLNSSRGVLFHLAVVEKEKKKKKALLEIFTVILTTSSLYLSSVPGTLSAAFHTADRSPWVQFFSCEKLGNDTQPFCSAEMLQTVFTATFTDTLWLALFSSSSHSCLAHI